MFLEESYIKKRNLTKLVYVRKEKKPKLEIFISLLFKGKNHKIGNANSNIAFPQLHVKKTIFFDFNKRRYSETLKKPEVELEFKLILIYYY